MSGSTGLRYIRMTQLLESKNAIIYGAAGSIGSAVARTFAREGATDHLVGRTQATLEAVAADLPGATVTVLDALDEEAVAAHVEKVGKVDISFNLVQRGDVQGQPLLEMAADDFLRPIATGALTSFVTARAAARAMSRAGGGVILHLNSGSGSAAAPMMGGTGPADAAVESFMRYLAAETGSFGVRVAGIWTAAVADSLTKEKLVAVGGPNMPDPEIIIQGITQMTMLKRPPMLQEVAETAAFLASDRASGITSTMVNVTCGLLPA
jgi:NAD(P)-dependent dehydrogenase (short-subunit alcohol dehydrogenase family)